MITRKALLSITVVIVVYLIASPLSKAQWSYGTTGILNMPSADMNENGTFMTGASYLNKHVSSSRWFYDTYGYYVNITFFSFFEFSYNMMLHKGMYDDYGLQHNGYWVPYTYGKFCNQDRQMSLKVMLWKEGWVKKWTPQICIGSDDITSNSWGRTGDRFAIEDDRGNGFNNRYYAAVTKHFILRNAGTVGTHVSYLYNVRSDYSLNAPSFGANFLFGLDEKNTLNRIANGLNLMVELYPANGQGYVYEGGYTKKYGLDRGCHMGIYDINVGAEYSLTLVNKRNVNKSMDGRTSSDGCSVMGLNWWQSLKEKIASVTLRDGGTMDEDASPLVELKLYAELYGCAHPSAGFRFSIHLQ